MAIIVGVSQTAWPLKDGAEEADHVSKHATGLGDAQQLVRRSVGPCKARVEVHNSFENID